MHYYATVIIFSILNVSAQIEIDLNKKITKFEHNISMAKSLDKHEMNISLSVPTMELIPTDKNSDFLELTHDKLQFLQNPGAPKVPYITQIVTAEPQDIEIEINKSTPYTLNALLMPAQKEECRCETDKKNEFVFNQKEYQKNRSLVTMDYLGKYRGQPLTRVLVKLASSDIKNNQTQIYSTLDVKISSKKNLNRKIQVLPHESEADYLIVGPKKLTDGLKEWMEFKKESNFRFKIINVEAEQALDSKHLHSIFKSEYVKHKYVYALIVGDAKQVATNYVDTQWDINTQSDYGYFLMDGVEDIIPDVLYGRVVASTVENVIYQSKKWIKYELEQTQLPRISKMIGIASNEGLTPSDDDYIRSIESVLSTNYKTKITHFYQSDIESNSKNINAAFSRGAHWLTYMGHGDGKSWPSTYDWYSVDDIKSMNNQNVAQPIVIDVACENGKLNQGFFGDRMVNEAKSDYLFKRRNTSIGAAVYYGGSVFISWHPPAIMAQGMVQEQVSQKLNKIGDIILAGHLHLMKNYSDLEGVRDNFKWYHLFGDPSLSVQF